MDVTGDENVTSVNASVQSTAAAADDDVASITPTNTMPISKLISTLHPTLLFLVRLWAVA